MTTYWRGSTPEKCDLRKEPLTERFVDGAILNPFGRWALMCPECYKLFGVGLGTGLGQEYTRQLDGKWLKTAG